MNIIRLYNQNRRQIFLVLIVIAAIIFAIHLANYLVKSDNNKNLNSGFNSSSTTSTTTINQSQQSAISSSSVSNSVFKVQSELIDEFIKYCNEGKVSNAYDLLSKDCKEVMFPTLEYFTNNYQKVIFSTKQIYTIKNWTGSTYKISLTENILATGKSNNGIATEDYYTIVNEGGKDKLNINGFVERNKLNKSNSSNNVKIEAICQDIYMDYTIFTFKATNNTDKMISLDSGESTKNMYTIDNNNIKFMSSRNELANAELNIQSYSNKTIKVKYLSSYVSTRTINYVVFNDIVLDVNTYKTYSDKESYKDRAVVKINL